MNNEKNTTAQEMQEMQEMQETPVEHAVQAPPILTPDVNQYAITANNASPVYCTMDASSWEGKKRLLKIKSRPDHNIGDFINKTIRIKDIYIDVNSRVSKDPDKLGVVEDKPRTIIVDDKGESYVAGVSIGVYNAIKEIIRTFGEPSTWEQPIDVMVVQITTPRGKMLSLDVI